MIADTLATIDATVDGHCACGCGRQLDPAGPSAWFAGADCQWRYQQPHAADPGDVYGRPDAASVLVGADHVPIPLTGPVARRDSDAVDAYRYAWSAALEHLGPDGGIITAVPRSSPPLLTPDDVWANVQRMFEQIRDQPWYPPPPGRQFRCGQTLRDTMAQTVRDTMGTGPAPPWRPSETLFGVPVVVDESMPPTSWRLVDADGNVLGEGTGVR